MSDEEDENVKSNDESMIEHNLSNLEEENLNFIKDIK